MHNPSEQHATERERVESKNGKNIENVLRHNTISARRKSMGKMRKLVCIAGEKCRKNNNTQPYYNNSRPHSGY